MKFLKSYTGAMVVLAAVILLAIPLGSHRSLVAERDKVEAQFDLIAGDLQDCLDITANLGTVAGRYLDYEELLGLLDSRVALEDGLGLRDIPAARAAYEDLTAEAEEVFSALEGQALTEKDAKYVQGFRTDLAAEADTIARDSYNDLADDYNARVLGSFPASLLGRLTFVRPAAVFR